MDAPSLLGCLQRITAESNKTALLLSNGDHWTYQQIREAFSSAPELNGKVGVLIEDRYLAGLVAGAVMNVTTCVPLDPKLTLSELKERIELLGIQTIVAQSNKWQELATPGLLRVRPENHQLIWDGDAASAESSQAALILMTSGSTGVPKLVALSHENLDHSATAIIDSLALGPADRAVNLLPMMHIGGLFDLFFVPLIAGGSVVFAEASDSKAIVSILENDQPTWLQGAPAMLQSILRHQNNIPVRHQLRFIRSVSAPLSEKLHTEISDFFDTPVVEMYGMSETAGVITSNPLPPNEQKIASVGVAVNCQVEIRNDNEVWVKSKGLFAGYSTDEDNKGLWDGEWFFTGDLGSLDEDGYLFLNGRAKEVINRGGQKISPKEIDELVESWPEIKEAAAFGFAHPTLGEEVGLALVAADSDLTDDEIRARLSKKLATYKLPRRLLRLDKLPRNQGGKLQRHLLRDHQDQGVDPKRSTLTPTEERVRKLWCAALDETSAEAEQDFFEQGGDSLSATTLLTSLEKEFKVSLAGFIFYENSTIRQIASHLDSRNDSFAKVEKRDLDFPPRVRKRLTSILSSWPGAPAFPGAYARMNPEPRADIPKFFWCCNSVGESTGIADAVGDYLEVVSFRTLRSVQNKKLRNIDQITRIFADDIQRIQPQGPLLLGGFCEGGRLMVLIAKKLIEHGRTIQLLVLHDHLLYEPLDTHLALIYSENWKRYPPKFYADIKLGWQKLHQGRFGMVTRSGRHGYKINNPELTHLVHQFVKEQLSASAHSKKSPIPRQYPSCSVESLSKTPFAMKSKKDYLVKVRITNRGDKMLQARDGIVLHARWVDLNRDEKFGEPMWTHLSTDLSPGESQELDISIKAPKKNRLYQLQIAVIEEGFGWDDHALNKSFRRWRLIR